MVQFGMVECSQEADSSTYRLRPGTYFGETGVLGMESANTYTSIGASVVASVPADVMCQFEDLLRNIVQEMQLNSPMAKQEPAGQKAILKLDSLSNIRKLKLVGVGGYGMVFLVQAEGRVYAMKALMKDHILQSKMATQ
eukprot:160295-Prorocentrum_minimum.AAC.1